MKKIEKALKSSKYIYNKIINMQDDKLSSMPENDIDNSYNSEIFSSTTISENINKLKNIRTEEYYNTVEKYIKKSKRRQFFVGLYRVAAVVAIVLSFTILYKYSSDYNVEIISLNTPSKIVKKKVGKPILITSTGERLVIGESNLKDKDKALVNVSNKSLEYSKESKVLSIEPIYNTLIVPKYGLFTLTLSDGTKVWLNSETEIKYPSVFSKNKREVFIKGEAFFEVVKNNRKPFYVYAGGSTVKVLGTGFNVRSYKQKPLITTLVHGKVKISDKSNSVILEPGNQALVTNNGIKIKMVDTEMFTAWKDGYFVFKEISLGEILEQLSEWYDFRYEFVDESTKELRFTSKLKKVDDLQRVIQILNKTNKVRISIRGNKLKIRKRVK